MLIKTLVFSPKRILPPAACVSFFWHVAAMCDDGKLRIPTMEAIIHGWCDIVARVHTGYMKKETARASAAMKTGGGAGAGAGAALSPKPGTIVLDIDDTILWEANDKTHQCASQNTLTGGPVVVKEDTIDMRHVRRPIQKLKERCGMRLQFVTARKESPENRSGTFEQLKAHGWVKGSYDGLYMRTPGSHDIDGEKWAAREFITGQTGPILLTVGDRTTDLTLDEHWDHRVVLEAFDTRAPERHPPLPDKKVKTGKDVTPHHIAFLKLDVGTDKASYGIKLPDPDR